MKKALVLVLIFIFSIQTSYAEGWALPQEFTVDLHQDFITIYNSLSTAQNLIDFVKTYVGTEQSESVAKSFQRQGIGRNIVLPKFSLLENDVIMQGTKQVVFTFSAQTLFPIVQNGKIFQFDKSKNLDENVESFEKTLGPKKEQKTHASFSNLFTSDAYATTDDIEKEHKENTSSSIMLFGWSYAFMVFTVALLGTLTAPGLIAIFAVAVILGLTSKYFLDKNTDEKYKKFAYNCPKDLSGRATLNVADVDLNINFKNGHVVSFESASTQKSDKYFVDKDWNFSGVQRFKQGYTPVSEFPPKHNSITDYDLKLLASVKELTQVCAHPKILAEMQSSLGIIQERLNASNSSGRSNHDRATTNFGR